MCGILGIFGTSVNQGAIDLGLRTQSHRGPDVNAYKELSSGILGHNRLKIVDLTDKANQPMSDSTNRYWLVFNGEIYNYKELRHELGFAHEFRTNSDSEVLLASYIKWGELCLNKLNGMFAFVIWDNKLNELFAATDRFGVKPLYYHFSNGGFKFASEIKSLHDLGVPKETDWETWATYIRHGLYDHDSYTFFKNIFRLRGGHWIKWSQGTIPHIRQWYEFIDQVSSYDERDESLVAEEYTHLLQDATKLRFRADVPIGVNLSGGLDSSLLLGIIHKNRGDMDSTQVFTFATGDSNYDELPYVMNMIKLTNHKLNTCLLQASDIPELMQKISDSQDEPFGGIPVIAYSLIFDRAKSLGLRVLMDGQGMDEQWGGYDYYRKPDSLATIQGSRSKAVRPECMKPDFYRLSRSWAPPKPFSDSLRNLQYRDLFFTKIPRALRFNDRVSMMHSIELREPFLDYRLVELAFRQKESRKISPTLGKILLRKIAQRSIPTSSSIAPKRPLQTPQREWLRGPLADWRSNELKLIWNKNSFLNKNIAIDQLAEFDSGRSDNSFFIWQWLSLARVCR